MSYAQNTAVPIERSKVEIEGILRRYGAEKFVSGWDADRVMVGFQAHGKLLRFTLPIPPISEFTRAVKWGVERDIPEGQAERARDQEVRRLWRALGLAIKAKLEAVECGIATFEEEFLSHIVIPDDTRGKSMPIDDKPDPTGNVFIDVGGCANVLTLTEERPPGVVLWMPHWSTCPNAAMHRKAREA